MIVTHSGETFECDTAVRCESDKYIKLYKNGEEIAAFYNISDFSEYTISGGSFTYPCECDNPILLTTYAIKGCTIATNDWILSDDGSKYYYEIESGLFSGNAKTCNILLFFAEGTELSYTAEQANGKITFFTDAAPLADVVIDSIQITRT